MKRSQFVKKAPNPPRPSSICGHYVRQYDDILLLPKFIDVGEVFADEDGIKVRFTNDRGLEEIRPVQYLTNFCRNEKEKRHAKYFKAG
jgi:hypothetical protein